MKILLVQNQFPDTRHEGGISTFGWFFAHGLINNGHTVHIICQSDYDEDEKLIEINERLHLYRVSAPKNKFAINAWKKANLLVSDGLQFDIIHASDYKASAYYFLKKRLSTAPVVVMCHTPDFIASAINENENRKFKLAVTPKIYKLEKFAIENGDHCISPSNRMAQLLSSHTNRSINDFTIIPYPYPIHQEIQMKPTVVDISTPYILFTGRIENRKGVKTLLNAWKKSTASKTHSLILAGKKTNHYPDFEHFVKENNLKQIVFLGEKSRSELSWLYRNASLVVLPSEPFDNFPYTCIEALSYGVPVLASNSGGMSEMITDGQNGWLFTISNSDELKTKMELILELPLSEKMKTGNNGQDYVQRVLNSNRIIQLHLNLYQKLLDSRK